MSSSSKAALSSPRAFNQSRVKLFNRCQQAYYFRYDYPIMVMGAPTHSELVPRLPSLPLHRGSWMHTLMQAHWLDLAGLPIERKIIRNHRVKNPKVRVVKTRGWEETNEQLRAEFNRLLDEEQEKYGNLPDEAARMFRAYLRKYKGDADRYKIAKLPNGKPAVEFVIEYPLDKWGIYAPFKGRIDLVVEDLDMGGLWIRDAKWVKTIPSSDERMMSPQNLMYVPVMRAAGWDIRGFIYDYGRTTSPTVPRILMRSSQYGPAGFVSLAKCDTDMATYVARMKEAHGKKWKKYARTYYKEKLIELKTRDVLWFKREPIPVEGPRVKQGLIEFLRTARNIQNRGGPVRNYIYSCRWNCDYHEACVADFQGLDIERLMQTQFQIEQESYAPEEID